MDLHELGACNIPYVNPRILNPYVKKHFEFSGGAVGEFSGGAY